MAIYNISTSSVGGHGAVETVTSSRQTAGCVVDGLQVRPMHGTTQPKTGHVEHMKKVRRLGSFVLVMLVLAACGSDDVTLSTKGDAVPSGDAAMAETLCNGEGLVSANEYAADAQLLQSHSTSPSQFAEWERSRFGPDGPTPVPRKRVERDQEQFLALCYYGGNFTAMPRGPARPDGSSPPAHDRLALTVAADGTVTLYQSGPSDRVDTSDTPSAS